MIFLLYWASLQEYNNIMKKIAVVGSNGKMGGVVCLELSKNYDIVKIDKDDDMSDAMDAEIVVDFSSGSNSAKVAAWCAKFYKKLIIGSTGQSKNELKTIYKASEKIPIVMSGNFSLGVLKMRQIIDVLIYDKLESVTILEKHHKNKKDSPSGTALMFYDLIKSKTGAPIDVLSVRGGKEIGTHELSFYYEDEVVKFTHQAFSRTAFAKGVVCAIKFLEGCKNPGMYDFCRG